MARTKNQLIGRAGEYHVAYCLAVRQFHAAITVGNAPHVDIIAASGEGSSLLSVQVKTRWAGCRCKWYGHEVWQWDVGAAAVGRHSPNLWHAFVDFHQEVVGKPTVFLVPSLCVAETVKADWTRKIYPLKIEREPLCKERWDLIQKYFNRDSEALNWSTTVPSQAKL